MKNESAMMRFRGMFGKDFIICLRAAFKQFPCPVFAFQCPAIDLFSLLIGNPANRDRSKLPPLSPAGGCQGRFPACHSRPMVV